MGKMSEEPSISNTKEKVKTKKTNSNKLGYSKGVFTCKYCVSKFTQKTNLYRHIRLLHKCRADLPLNIKPATVLDKQNCSHCNEEFNSQSLLSFHRALIHPVRKGKIVITCSICPFSGSKSELLGHYVAEHNVKIEIEEHNFPTSLEFYVWKSNIERDTLTQYAKRQKHHVLVNGVIIDTLYCHRDGFYRPEGRNLRNVKVKGTNKINGYCPAFMKVMTYADEHVSVLFLKTHVGHNYDLERLTLTREERDCIAAKMAAGISLDDILTELHSSKHERLRIMTRKDLYNIEVSYHLKSIRGKQTKCKSVLAQHEEALNIPQSYVTLGNNCWHVKSTIKDDVVYKVELNNTDCDIDTCNLKCHLCNCCGHNYLCSCSDNERIKTMCEHKHLVHLTRREPETQIQQNNCLVVANNYCDNVNNDVLVNNEIPSSTVPTLTTNTQLDAPIMLDNCPQLTTLVLEDIPPAVSGTEAMYMPTDVNASKSAIRTQLATILQAVESSVLVEELHLIQSLLEPVVQTVQSVKDPDEIIAPEVIQPICKQLRLDDETASSFFTTANTNGASLLTSSQLQSSVIDHHNNTVLITYTINQPSQE